MSKISLVDVHVYGGAVIFSAGMAMWSAWAGPVAFGAILITLGLRRP